MPRQALNTLYTLSGEYQQNVNESDYEIIAVENRSECNIDEVELQKLRGNFRYFLREESLPTPVNAINFGVEQCLSSHLTPVLVSLQRENCSKTVMNRYLKVPVMV